MPLVRVKFDLIYLSLIHFQFELRKLELSPLYL